MFILRALPVLLLALCLIGCPVSVETRSIAAVVGKRAGGPKLNNLQIEALLPGLTKRLYAAGFVRESLPSASQPVQPFSHEDFWGGGRAYSAAFSMEPRLRCSVLFDLGKLVRVDFYEQANLPYGSHVYSASDEQRQKVRALASQIENYLRANLPSFYRINITFGPPAT